MPDVKDSQAGFSVLEAIIAMAILSLALIPILSLQGRFFQTVEVIERAEWRIIDQDNVINYFRSINMDKSPSGNVTLGATEVSWTSTRQESARETWLGRDDPGRYKISLYVVRVSVETEDGLYRESFNLKALGWSALWPSL